ncbi:MAG TPA: hypothetical protein VK858_04365 [Longimicrobiales bacterium]|nr:hypothetical protein [Longimicrobiales bacterium]
MTKRLRRLCGLWIGGGLAPMALTAQLPGVTLPSPPGLDRVFEMRFANDFLGRGGAIDDFRTQELSLVTRLSPAWTVVIDHSILTSSQPANGSPGRVDHLTLSAGRRFPLRGRPVPSFEVGLGLRYSGDAGGSRIQNGFHQLVGSTLETMPYVGTDRVDGLLWIAAPLAGTFRRGDGRSLLGGGWELGYWIRSATLVSTDAEWDGSVGGFAVFSRGFFQSWIGVRGDWRRGHDRDPVTAATADFESGGAGVLGLRVGPLILETAQGFDGEAAYGHLSLVSSGSLPAAGLEASGAVGVEAGFTLPDVTARVRARWWPGADPEDPGWRPSLAVEARFGQPQYGADVNRFVETLQLSGSVEMERTPLASLPWLGVFGGAGAGWRQERLEGFGGSDDELRSAVVGSVGLTGDLGIRVGTGTGSGRVGLVLQTGLSGWLPASTRTADFGGASERLLEPDVQLTTGILARIRTGGGT